MSSKHGNLTQCLLKLDACAVSDALDKLGLPPAVTGLRPLSVARKIAGPVVTVQLGPNDPGGHRRHLGTAAIEAARVGDVLVIAHAAREDCAGWGGVLSLGARSKGVSGVIVDGAARDIDEATALNFPIYAAQATAVTARGRAFEQSYNEPVAVKSVPVAPRDFVIADSSGVAFLPASRADEIVDTAEHIARRENAMMRELENGAPISHVMGKDYEDMLE